MQKCLSRRGMLFRGFSLVALPMVASTSWQPLFADESLAGLTMSPDQTRASVQWLAGQLMLHVPRRIEGDDDWGDTKTVWTGVKMRADGWKIKTHRRQRELRHGRWLRYEIDLPQPVTASEHGEVTTHAVTVRSVVPVRTDDLSAGWRVDASVSTPATFYVRLQRWNLGVQLFSVSIEGKMNLQMDTQLTLGMRADFAEVPPAMELNVGVEEARLSIEGFEVDRISRIGGDVAEELGDLAENTIGKAWKKKENDRLVRRLNGAIEDNHEDLRWSMADWLAQLGK